MRMLIGIFLLLGVAMTAQDTKYPLTELQLLRLKVVQRDAQIAQQNVFIAQQNFATAMAALTAESERVKAENKWAPEVQFMADQLTFADPLPNIIKKEGVIEIHPPDTGAKLRGTK